MQNKYYNEAFVGNSNLRASYSTCGEILRIYFPQVDYRQFVDFFHTGIKINDSNIIYLHEDINNKYKSYYIENTNILNTEIENTYFSLKIISTDCALIDKNILVKKYKFKNNNKIDLNLSFIVRSCLLTDSNNMVSGKIIENGLIQYMHDYSFNIFGDKKLNGHKINDIKNNICSGVLEDKDYIGMSNDSGISFEIGNLKPGEEIEFYLKINIEDNSNIENIYNIEEKIEEYNKLDYEKEIEKTKKYWEEYLKNHDGLNLLNTNNDIYNYNKMIDIYKRSILLFPLLTNNDTGGISAAFEIDENLTLCGRYSYCWPRDAIFITKALDILNMKEESEKFYKVFCEKTQSKNGMWEQRFYTDGRLAPCWGYQIDETASIIYGAFEHYKKDKENIEFLKDIFDMLEKAFKFLCNYLDNLENESFMSYELEKRISYDLWEMNEGIHLYSLSSIYGAFDSMKEIYSILNNNKFKIEKYKEKINIIEEKEKYIKEYILENLVDKEQNILKRNKEESKIDISTLGSVIPFKVFDINDKIVLNWIEKVDFTLRTNKGAYLRFEEDNYREGKDIWPITTLWMAMYFIEKEEINKAKDAIDYIIDTSTKYGFLGEQVDINKNETSWAIGLGWSHAMFINILEIMKNKNLI